jgi:hypothetical protein
VQVKNLFPSRLPASNEMKWDMELEEIEAVLEKIWDLHDKLSDAIHSISRSHFLHSIKSLKTTTTTTNKKLNNENDVGFEDNNSNSNNRASGFVFFKDFRVDGNDLSTIQEAKSLNSIRTALENLEDQLEFFHVSLVFGSMGFFFCICGFYLVSSNLSEMKGICEVFLGGFSFGGFVLGMV